MSDHPYCVPERKTCMPCRKRKVKCDGRSPKCGPCSAAKRELDCVFPMRPENRDKRNALPKGKACRSCRSKKKKCDGQHPICSTCSRSRDGQPCIYDEVNNISQHGDSDIDPEDDSPSTSPYASDGANGSHRYDRTPMSPQQHIPSSPDSDGMFSVPSSTPPCLAVLLAGDERVMSYFRDLAFSHALRLGICFTSLKEKFIRNGDMSGRVVHPWFVWFMNVMGIHLHQERRHLWEELRIQGTITQIILQMVYDMQESEQPPLLMLHVVSYMALACTYTHTIVPGQRYLLRCHKMVKKHGFGLVGPTWIDASSRGSPSTVDRPSEYTEEKHELVSILLHLMYLQCIHCLLYNKCHGLFADLEAQLPDFERAYPEVFELSSAVLRVRTLLLVRDVFLHIDLAKEEDLSQKEWLQDSANLMSRLTMIIKVLDNALGRSGNSGSVSPGENYQQRQTYLLMSSCKLFCMTAQARIYLETSKFPIVPKVKKEEFRDMARDSVHAFLLIYKSFDQEEDLRHLDYFTTACWQHIKDLYLVLYPGDLDWYPYTEVSRQIILLDSMLRVTPAGKGMSVMHSIANMVGDTQNGPNFLKEEDRLKHGL